jgi:hypothetical protein
VFTAIASSFLFIVVSSKLGPSVGGFWSVVVERIIKKREREKRKKGGKKGEKEKIKQKRKKRERDETSLNEGRSELIV